MKKILVVLVIALLALALVACGGSKSTKAKETAATTPVATDPANPGTETTPATGSDTTPATDSDTTPGTGAETTPSSTTVDTAPKDPEGGIDILYGDIENALIDIEFKNNGCAFEDKHPTHDYRNVFAIKVFYDDNGILDELIRIENPEESYSPYEMNEDYKWVVIINGEEYEISLFTYEHRITWGYVLCDLGDWDYDRDNLDENGQIAYDLRLEIIDRETDKVKYYAWFTDPDLFGLHYYTPTDLVVMVPDSNRDKTHAAIPSEDITPLEGPVSTSTEPYTFLFDGNIRTKLCTKKGDQTGTIIWKYKEPQYVASYSLIGANDDKKNPHRIPYSFEFYGSNDNKTWVLLDQQEFEQYKVAASYAERNFKVDASDLYEYFKLQINNTAQFQLSEVVLYTKVN